ncbi:MAG: response regulator transcription factor [Spirosomataceae bacterium]
MKRRILLVDDHQLFLEGLRFVLSQTPDVEIVGEALNGQLAIEMVEKHPINWVLMDINMPHCDGIEATKHIKKNNPKVKIIAVTMLDDYVSIKEMIRAGADGYILKNTGSAELHRAFETIENGEVYYTPSILNTLLQRQSTTSKRIQATHAPLHTWLTTREKELLPLLVEGLTSAEIAERLFVSESTIISHRKNILHKLNLKNTAALVKYALEHQLI